MGAEFAQAVLGIGTPLRTKMKKQELHAMHTISGNCKVSTTFSLTGHNMKEPITLKTFLATTQAKARAVFIYSNNNHFDLWWPEEAILDKLKQR